MVKYSCLGIVLDANPTPQIQPTSIPKMAALLKTIFSKFFIHKKY